MIKRIILLAASALLVAGCAAGNQYDYSNFKTELRQAEAGTLAVAVVDQRSYVLNGDKNPDFVGLQRAGFGNPFSVTTRSGRGLAADLTDVLTRSYIDAGTSAAGIELPKGTDDQAAIQAFQQQPADRFLLVKMLDWKTDVYAQITVIWDLEAKVFDRSGQLLASQSSRGTQGTGTNGAFEERRSELAQKEAASRFGELLNDPAIRAALDGG